MKSVLTTVFLFLTVGFLSLAVEPVPVSPADGALVSQLNAGHKKYLALPRAERIAYFASPEKRKEMRSAGYRPVPVQLRWNWSGANTADFTVTVSEKPDFSNAVTVDATRTHASVNNLRISAKYYWKVTANVDGKHFDSRTFTFLTEDRTPRLIRVDDLWNVRDLGGYHTLDGKRVRQNLVFRSGGLNNNASPVSEKAAAAPKTEKKKTVPVPSGYVVGETNLTPAGRKYMLESLKIRTEIDLRSDGECSGMTGSPLGSDVRWVHVSSASYGAMQRREGREAFAKVFRVFLDEKNYPIDFHCIAGQDRTGAVAFILNALLGVDEEHLYLDWETTGFWNGSPAFNHANLFNHLVEGFNSYPGKTVQERVKNYVLSLGFTEADIAKFRSIMLE